MKPRIIVGGYGRLLALARKVLTEMSIPEGVSVEYVESLAFIPGDAPPKMEPGDLFVCGHQTALALEKRFSLKSLPIRITGFDLLGAISEATKYSREITVINFFQDIQELDRYGELLKVRLLQKTFPDLDTLETILKDLKKRKCRVVIGSSLVCERAEREGIRSIFIYSQDNVRETLKYAVQIVATSLQETERAERLKSMLDYTYSGIIGTDTNLCISTFNHAAEKLLGLNSSDVIGRPIDTIFPDLELKEEKGDYHPKINRLGKFGKRQIVFSSVPIKADSTYFGQVTVIQDTETIRRAEENIRRNLHHKRFVAQYTFRNIAGSSPAICRSIEKAKVFADSDSAILIQGETGTGKELFAQSIHNFSRRRGRPFVSINCGALTESLLDSELFGYERGSFTGARSEGKTGLFEMAHTGTIFLDEVGEILPSVQVRLLRVLQEKEVMRIGGDRLIPIDVRIIAATNRNLWDLVQQGKFRQDLYYRLNVLELRVPALRERPEDLADLIKSMLATWAPHLHTTPAIANTMIVFLKDYAWPGNIRELENIMQRFAAMTKNMDPTAAICKRILSDCFQAGPKRNRLEKKLPGCAKKSEITDAAIAQALVLSSGNKTHAARKLGISRMTLFRILKKKEI